MTETTTKNPSNNRLRVVVRAWCDRRRANITTQHCDIKCFCFIACVSVENRPGQFDKTNSTHTHTFRAMRRFVLSHRCFGMAWTRWSIWRASASIHDMLIDHSIPIYLRKQYCGSVYTSVTPAWQTLIFVWRTAKQNNNKKKTNKQKNNNNNSTVLHWLPSIRANANETHFRTIGCRKNDNLNVFVCFVLVGINELARNAFLFSIQ